MGLLSQNTVPSLGVLNPDKILSNVDLPDPDLPMIAIISFLLIERQYGPKLKSEYCHLF